MLAASSPKHSQNVSFAASAAASASYYMSCADPNRNQLDVVTGVDDKGKRFLC